MTKQNNNQTNVVEIFNTSMRIDVKDRTIHFNFSYDDVKKIADPEHIRARGTLAKEILKTNWSVPLLRTVDCRPIHLSTDVLEDGTMVYHLYKLSKTDTGPYRTFYLRDDYNSHDAEQLTQLLVNTAGWIILEEDDPNFRGNTRGCRGTRSSHKE